MPVIQSQHSETVVAGKRHLAVVQSRDHQPRRRWVHLPRYSFALESLYHYLNPYGPSHGNSFFQREYRGLGPPEYYNRPSEKEVSIGLVVVRCQTIPDACASPFRTLALLSLSPRPPPVHVLSK